MTNCINYKYTISLHFDSIEKAKNFEDASTEGKMLIVKNELKTELNHEDSAIGSLIWKRS